MTPSPSPDHDAGIATRRFFGNLLVMLGGIWMALCGGCTVVVVIIELVGAVTSAVSGSSPGAVLTVLPEFLLFGLIGLICALPGIGLFFIGRTIRQKTR
jgi:hypothetical protein